MKPAFVVLGALALLAMQLAAAPRAQEGGGTGGDPAQAPAQAPPAKDAPATDTPRKEAGDAPAGGAGEGRGRDGKKQASLPADRTLELGEIPLEELTGAERDQAETLLHVRLEEQYFLASDADGNGWVSFREALSRLQVDRSEFFLFDADQDGRIARDEFGARYRYTVESVGSFRPPVTPKSLFPTPEGSPLAFDLNASGALEQRELSAFLAAKGIHAPVNALLGHLDANKSNALELEEFAAVLATLAPLVPDGTEAAAAPPLPTPPAPAEPAGEKAPPTTILELFGASQARDARYGTVPGPDRIQGPIPHFDRLDADHDGFIEEDDLLQLLRPAQVGVRAGTVLAALDRDGDRRLSRAEIAQAMLKRSDG